MKITGIVLLVLGLLAFIFGGVRYTTRDTVVDIGPIHATADRTHTLPIAPVAGVLLIAGGTVVLLASRRRTA
jgi:hypothetical protein